MIYNDLKGKKLLLIGSDAGNINIIKVAHELGVYVIVVDGISDHSKAPAKKVADEAWDIDYSDIETISAKCKEAKVNGVFAGYSEFRVLAACRIANALGLPFYATEEQIELTRNKRLFKDACVQYGIRVPKDYCFKYPMSEEEKASIEYPVIVKPADYAGRKGISVCQKAEELEAAVEFAAKMSQSKTVIVEEYLDGIEFASIYTIKDGEYSLSCVNEKYITDDQEVKSGLCEFLISPANSYQRYLDEVDQSCRDFMKGIKAENGVIFFQGMVTEKRIYIFEMGYRINGNNDFQVVEKINGINFLKMLICHSLTGDMRDDLSKDNPLYGKYACTLLFYAHAGTIGKMECKGLYECPNISDIHEYGWVGKSIAEDGSTGQKVINMKIMATTLEELVEVVEFAQKNVVVEDTNGNNMLFKKFDAKCLLR